METYDEAHMRYTRAAHAMQTGVAFTMERDPAGTSPKMLRVGVNAAMVEHGALAKILIAKGIMTDAEYMSAYADMMEIEVEKYRTRLEELFGAPVELG